MGDQLGWRESKLSEEMNMKHMRQVYGDLWFALFQNSSEGMGCLRELQSGK